MLWEMIIRIYFCLYLAYIVSIHPRRLMQQSYILLEVLSLILFVIVSSAMDQPLSWLFVHSVLTFCLMFGLRDQSPTASEKEVQNVRLYTTLSLSRSLCCLKP
jgi:peptidoglycan/LPS O-acetylase OafA/YrhL